MATETIELEDAFADASLEMDEAGEKFRVAAALQSAVAAAGAAAVAAQATATAAQADADAVQADVDALEPRVAALEADSGGGGGGGTPLTVLPGMHVARAYRVGTASIAGGTFSLIPFNTVKYDPAGLWSAADSGFKPKLPGYYLVTSRVESTTNVLYQMALIGSTSYFATGHDQHGSWAVGGSGLLYCNGTTDTITVKVNASAGWNTASSDDFNTWVEVAGPFGVSPPDGAVSGSTNRFWARPPVPDAFDDEFAFGSSPDLAARGWTVRNGSDGSVQTRVGDVIWTGNPGLGANQYRSTITRDGLCMQTSIDTWVYKTVAGSLQLRASMVMSAPTVGGFYCSLQAWNEASPILNATLSRLYVSPQGGNLIAEQMVPNNSYTSLVSVSAGTPDTLQASELFVDVTPTAQRYWAFTTKGFARLEAAGAINPFNPAVAGFSVATHGGAAALRWCTIKYVRKAAQGSFPV